MTGGKEEPRSRWTTKGARARPSMRSSIERREREGREDQEKAAGVKQESILGGWLGHRGVEAHGGRPAKGPREDGCSFTGGVGVGGRPNLQQDTVSGLSAFAHVPSTQNVIPAFCT